MTPKNDHGLFNWHLSHTLSASFEYLLAATLIAFCLFQERGLLFFPHFIAPHDNFYFLFPIFFHFADSIFSGQLPLWNPYSHGGEVFYPLLVHAQLLDPVAWFVVLVGKCFTRDLSLLFHWNLFVHGQIFCLGSFLYLRRGAKSVWTRYLLLAVLELSSLNLAYLRQPGFLYQSQWLPWILFCLAGLYHSHGRNLRYWVGTAIFVALQMQSYWFSGSLTFLLLGALALLLWHKERYLTVLSAPGIAKKLTFLTVFLLLASLPNVSLLLKQKEWMSPMRGATLTSSQMTGAPVLYETPNASGKGFAWIPISEVSMTGTFSKLTDFFQLVYAHGNRAIHKSIFAWGSPSEAWMYIGLIPLLLSLIGFFLAIDEWKRVWSTLLVSIFMVSLGPAYLLYQLIYYFFPSLWYLRHLHTLQPFFLLSLLYFMALGSDHLLGAFLKDPDQESKVSRLQNKFSVNSVSRKGPQCFVALLLLFITAIGSHFLISDEWARFTEIRLLFFVGVLAFFLIHRLLGAWPTIFSFTLLLFTTAATRCSDPLAYLSHIFFLFFVPIVFTYYAYNKRSPHLFAERDSKHTVLGIVLVLVLIDLGMGFKAANYLYQGQPNPTHTFDLDLKSQLPPSPGNRIPFSYLHANPAPTDPGAEQAPRYLSVLSRTPSALSELWKPETPRALTFSSALGKQRWNSFLLQKNYHELVHSKLPAEVQQKLFTIGKSPFQWTPHAHFVSTTAEGLEILSRSNSKKFPYVPLVIENGKDTRKSHPSDSRENQFEHLIAHYTHNDYALETKTDRDGYLYWSDGYDPDWQVTIDGVETELYKANIAFKAFRLSAGMHHIELKFRPLAFLISAGVYFLILFLAALALGLYECYQIFLIKFWRAYSPLSA